MASRKGCEYYDKKLTQMNLIDWQFLDGEEWKSFAKQGGDTAADSVTIESAFQANKNDCTVNHGWYKTFKISFENKTSTNTRSSASKSIRRWCLKTLKELHQDEVNEMRSKYLKKNSRSAKKLWANYFKGGKFDFKSFFEDIGATNIVDMNVFVWFHKCEVMPKDMDEQAFYLACAQLSNATSVKNIKNAIETEKRNLVRNASTWKAFYKWIFFFVAKGLTKKAVIINETGNRIDPADGAAYSMKDVLEYYGDTEGVANWAKFEKERRRELCQWELLLKFKGINKMMIQPGTKMGGLVDEWMKFLTARPESPFQNAFESVGQDEWWCIFEYLSGLKTKWADYDEYAAPSLVSEFKKWAFETYPENPSDGGGDGGDGDW